MKDNSTNRGEGHGEDEVRDPRIIQNRLTALLDYMEQVEKLNRKPAFVVPTDFYCVYEDQLRGLPGIEFDLTADGDELWLRVPRLKEEDPPPIPETLKPWMVVFRSPERHPTLRDEVTLPGRNAGEPTRTLARSELPEIDAAFEAYLSGPWVAWSEYERPRRQTIAVYNGLFSIHQTMESEGTETPLELGWGVGIALWKHPSGQQIAYPILTQLVEIGLDTRTLALEIRPREALPTLETDAFAALEVPGVVRIETAWREHLKHEELTLSPFDTKSFGPILKASVGFLDPGGRYWPEVRKDTEDRRLPERTGQLTVTDTWVLYARKRSPNFLIEDLQRLKANLELIETVPGGPAALVSEPADAIRPLKPVFFRGVSFSGGELPPGSQPKELYFPKPYNEEQVSIVRKLETSDGVVVQGPPGTGKTHTIANVICHHLANGKRVLVISKGEPALAVLREHIPESVRPLVVALLTDEKDGMRQFEHAIQVIAATVSHINPSDVEQQVSGLAKHIDGLHSKLAAIDREISQWAAQHLRRVRFQGREILPEELARYVVDRGNSYDWFPDKLANQPAKMLFSNADIGAVRTARITLGANLVYFGVELPAADSFPDGNVILQVHEDLLTARRLATEIQADGLPPLISAHPETLEKAQSLHRLIHEALRQVEKAYAAGYSYTATIHQSYRSANAPLLAVLDGLLKAVAEMEKERQEFLQRPVEVPSDAEVDEEFVVAVDRSRNGKSPLGLVTFGKSHLKAKLLGVTVLGLKPQNEGDWTHVSNWLEFRKRCRALIARWNSTAGEFKLPTIEHSTADALRHLVGHVDHITIVKLIATDYERRIPHLASEVFGENLPQDAPGQSSKSLARLAEILSRHITRSRLAYASNTVSDLVAKLSGKGGSIVERMRAFITKELGTEIAVAAEAGERWHSLLSELRRLASLRGELAEVARVSQLVERTGAPNWAGALRTKPALDAEDRWTPADWLEAWQWRRATTFLEAIDGREQLGRLQAARRETETDLERAYQKLVEQKTWIEVFKNSPDSVKAALQAYLSAVMHIGRGTGIRAIRYRKEARNAMLNAYRAVPCWVMPQWRVSETLPPEIGKFDLVIVDEASQSDLWALPCLLRGEKLLVVGDDKQVSPDGIGLAEEKIKDLKNRFLKDQVHGDQMTPEKSLYDLAKVVFAGQMVMLREHFRCVAPIIEFSRREFYRNEIQPLRIPRASERLEPPLIDVFVKGGMRKGKVNEPEARAIVDEIKKILCDTRFAKRSIGVVSLLGIEQAHRIFELIKEEIPPEEIVTRKMTVGDARTFQGKERDIMLMSMVATVDQKITATASTYEQRFNVAASRARDRMYLFRSVETSDLNKNDLKAKLIEHFAAPFREDPVKITSLRELCQSGFEREIFDILVGKCYRVRPQVKVGAYSIDLVIEGEEDRRLAIECDGDQYHGPEKWAADMARQRVLERSGWTFWRCFSSTFTRNRQVVMDDLIQNFKNMGIEPIGAAELDVGRYTEHRIVDPFGVGEAVEEILAGQVPVRLK